MSSATSVRILSDSSVSSATFAFALTRAIVFLVFLLGTNLTIKEPIRDFGSGIQDVSISLTRNTGENLRRGITAADSAWQMDIARNGYEKIPFNATVEHNWAFFPLYPLLLRAASKLTGEFALTGAMLSTTLFFFALVFLHKTAIEFGLDQAAAERTVFFVAAFPTSFFFSLPLGESLFLLLTVASVYAAKRDRWWLAGIIGGFASALRFFGILLLPVLLLLYFQIHGRRMHVRLLAVLLVPLGLIAYMWHLHELTGNALAFRDVQVAWNHQPVFFIQSLLAYIRRPAELSFSWNFILLNFSAAVMALVAGLVLLRKREWALAFYTLASVLIPLSYPASPLQSVARYVLVIFPVFMVLAGVAKSSRLDQTIRAIFIVLLGLMTALYSLHFSPALS